MINLHCSRWYALVLTGVASYAQAAIPERSVATPFATLGKLGMALAFVLVAFWLVARVMRHLQGPQGRAHTSLHIVGALSLGNREKIVVVQAGDEQLVLGVTASQVNKLHVLNQPLATIQTPELSDFRLKLKAAMKRQAVS
jgi:flagellar protein FliO/FliZ